MALDLIKSYIDKQLQKVQDEPVQEKVCLHLKNFSQYSGTLSLDYQQIALIESEKTTTDQTKSLELFKKKSQINQLVVTINSFPDSSANILNVAYLAKVFEAFRKFYKNIHSISINYKIQQNSLQLTDQDVEEYIKDVNDEVKDLISYYYKKNQLKTLTLSLKISNFSEYKHFTELFRFISSLNLDHFDIRQLSEGSQWENIDFLAYELEIPNSLKSLSYFDIGLNQQTLQTFNARIYQLHFLKSLKIQLESSFENQISEHLIPELLMKVNNLKDIEDFSLKIKGLDNSYEYMEDEFDTQYQTLRQFFRPNTSLTHLEFSNLLQKSYLRNIVQRAQCDMISNCENLKSLKMTYLNLEEVSEFDQQFLLKNKHLTSITLDLLDENRIQSYNLNTFIKQLATNTQIVQFNLKARNISMNQDLMQLIVSLKNLVNLDLEIDSAPCSRANRGCGQEDPKGTVQKFVKQAQKKLKFLTFFSYISRNNFYSEDIPQIIILRKLCILFFVYLKKQKFMKSLTNDIWMDVFEFYF